MHKTALAAAIAAERDPFDAVMQSLSDSAASVKGLLKDIDGVDNVVVTIDDVLNGLAKLPTDLKIIKDILMVLDKALLMLSPVPIVGQIAAAGEPAVSFASTTCGTVENAANDFVKAIIKPAAKAFDELRAGIQKAINILKTIAQSVPEYINTIQILSYLNRLAIPLVDLLKDSPAGKRLIKLTQEFDALQKEVTTILAPVAGFIKDLGIAISGIDQALGKAFQDVKSTAAAILSGLKEIEKFFRPIQVGFNKILHAIKPVKWALDALNFIFNKVVKPVIDAILKATGLNKAVFDPIREQVEEKLGIKSIVDMVEGTIGGGAAAWQKGAGVAAARAGAENWENLAKQLAKYSTRGDSGMKDDIMLLVNAITGGEIDPDAPLPDPPKWPDVPDFEGDDKSPAAKLFSDALSRNHRQTRLESGFSAMARINQATLTASGPRQLLLMDLLESDELAAASDMSNVDALMSKAKSAAEALRQVGGAGPQLIENLELFDQSRYLPTDFEEQMDDFAGLFDSSVDFVEFLVQFDVVKPVVAGLVEPLKQHSALAANIKTHANDLVVAGQAVDAQIRALEAAAPRPEVFTEALEFFDAAGSGAVSLAQVIGAAREVDHEHLDDRFKDRLDVLASKVNDAAGKVMQQMDAVESLSTSTIKDVGTINDYLGRYAGGYSSLHDNALIVGTDALPRLTKGVHYFGLFVSILDPLSCLLAKTVCKDADNSFKKNAARCIAALEKAADLIFSNNKQLVEQAFSFVIDKKVPMDGIRQEVEAIVNVARSGKPDFDAAVSRISANLAKLGTAMQPNQHYIDKGEQIDNVLVDEAFASAASALFEEIQKALPPSLDLA